MAQSTENPIRVLGFAGSLREGSYNKRLLRAAQELAPASMTIETITLEGLPFYNADVEKQGDPEPVQRFKAAIRSADAVLIATPEYQHGLPGVLKNALDWASRPPRQGPMQGKPVAMMGASPSMVGTARAHLQLRQTLTYNQCRMVTRPEVLVAEAPKKFEDGKLTDEKAREFIQKLLGALAEKVAEVRRLEETPINS